MRKKAIGIDLGTTNSVMAVVREDVPEIIPMGTNDDQVLRSAVYFSNIGGKNHVSFGKEAIERGTEIGSTENLNLTSNVILVVRLPVTHRIIHVLILLFFQPWF